MIRRTKGLYIYACDEDLRKELKKRIKGNYFICLMYKGKNDFRKCRVFFGRSCIWIFNMILLNQ